MDLSVRHLPGELLLAGELDIASAPALALAIATCVGDLVVDLADVEFCDVAGLRALLAARAALRAEGGDLVVRRPPATLDLVLGLLDHDLVVLPV